MGTRGPIPVRDAERRRRNEKAIPTTTVEELEPTEDVESLPFKIREGLPIPDADSSWHDIAKMLWTSMQHSGQALFYEPSDWATAYMLCESISRDFGEQVVGVTESGEKIYGEIPLKGASLSSYLKAFASLGLTEGDRRRMSIELERRKFGKPVAAEVVDIGATRKGRLA